MVAHEEISYSTQYLYILVNIGIFTYLCIDFSFDLCNIHNFYGGMTNMAIEVKKKKENGVIGRSSKATIKQRLEIGERIIKQANYRISKQAFLEKYEKKLKSMENSKCPTINTLRRDAEIIVSNIRKQNLNFEFRETDTEIDGTELSIEIGNTICDSIKQVRVSVYGYNHILFTSGKTKLKSKKTFGKTAQEKLEEEFQKNSIQPNNTAMAHLYIIFNMTGFEHYVSNFYKENFQNVLYTSTHEYCSEIVFEYKKLKSIIGQTYLILKSYYC